MSYSDEHLDQLLRASGEQWRASEPEMKPFSVATLVHRRGRARSFSLPLGAGASLAVVLIAAVSLLAIYFTRPLGSPSHTLVPSPLASSASPSPTTSAAPSPTSDLAGAACAAIIDHIPFVTIQSGKATIAAAYEVTGEQMTGYFVAELNQGNMSNGADWWNSPTKIVDMCVFDGVFEAQTPGPPGHDTTATRVLVVIDGSDVMSWAFCFASQSSCGIQTTDPRTIPAQGDRTLPTHIDLNGYPTALLEATLIREGDCLYARGEGGRWLAIWPSGFSISGDAVVNGGQQVAMIGDTVKLGGGEYQDSDYNFLRTLMPADVPAECRSTQYWLVSEVVS